MGDHDAQEEDHGDEHDDDNEDEVEDDTGGDRPDPTDGAGVRTHQIGTL